MSRISRTQGAIAALVAILAASALSPNPSGATSARTHACIEHTGPVLVIGDFEMIGGAPDTRFLGTSLSSMIQFLLLSKTQVGVVSRPCLWTTLMELPIEPHEIHAKRIFEEDVLISVGAEHFLTGTFLEVDRSFQIQAKLEELPFGDVKLEWATSVEYASVIDGLQELAEKVAGALARQRPENVGSASVVVSCFQDESRNERTETRALGKNLSRFVRLVLERSKYPGLTILQPDRPATPCSAAQAELERTAAETGADLVVAGTLRLEEDVLSVYPTILVAEFGTLIQLPFVEGSVDDYPLLRHEVGRSADEYVQKIHGRGGKGSFEELVLANAEPGKELEQGKLLFEQKDYGLSVPFFQQALKAQPDSSEAHRYLGLVYLHQGQIAAAIRALESAASLDPLDPVVLTGLGDAHFRSGNLAAAKGLYEKSLAFDKNDATAHKKLGYIFELEGDFDRAKERYENAKELQPRDPEALILLARLALKKRSFKDALDNYNQLLSFAENNNEAINGVIDVHRRNGQKLIGQARYEEAEAAFSQEISFRENRGRVSALPYFWRGVSRVQGHYTEWDIDGAIADFRAVLELDGRSDTGLPAPVEVSALRLLELYVMAGLYEETEALGWKKIKQFSSSPFLRPIARFYRTAAVMLSGKDYAVQMEILREELDSLRSQNFDQGFDWDLDNFMDYAQTSEEFEPIERSSIVKLTILLKEAIQPMTQAAR